MQLARLWRTLHIASSAALVYRMLVFHILAIVLQCGCWELLSGSISCVLHDRLVLLEYHAKIGAVPLAERHLLIKAAAMSPTARKAMATCQDRWSAVICTEIT